VLGLFRESGAEKHAAQFIAQAIDKIRICLFAEAFYEFEEFVIRRLAVMGTNALV